MLYDCVMIHLDMDGMMIALWIVLSKSHAVETHRIAIYTQLQWTPLLLYVRVVSAYDSLTNTLAMEWTLALVLGTGWGFTFLHFEQLYVGFPSAVMDL